MNTQSEMFFPVPEWLDDPALSAADPLPVVPSWLAEVPVGSAFVVPDCPCCVEFDVDLAVLADLVPAEPVGWAVPGVWGEPRPSPRPTPSAAVRALEVALSQVEQLDPTDLPVDQALVDTHALLNVEQRLRRYKLRQLADTRSRRLYHLDNEPSLSSWLRRRHPETATPDVTLSDKLRRYPILRSRVLGGGLRIEAARKVVAALGKATQHVDQRDGLIDGQPAASVIDAVVCNTVDLVLRGVMGLDDDDPRLPALITATGAIAGSVDTDLGKLEAAFVLLAEQLPVHLLPAALAQQLDALLPGKLEDRADSAHQSRKLTLRSNADQAGGDVVINADSELYELLWTALAAEARRDPANPADTTAAAQLREQDVNPYGEDALQEALLDQVADDGIAGLTRPRTKGQRLHDALKNLLTRYLDAGLAGVHDKTPVSITVTVPSQLLDTAPGALPAVGGSGKTLPASLIRRWWCDAKATAFVLSRGLIPLGQVHSQRTLTAAERKAALIQHGGSCAGLGCCRPGDPLVELFPHHLTPWADQHRTSLRETVLACTSLHHDIHHGKTLQLRNGKWINQNGWTQAPTSRW